MFTFIRTSELNKLRDEALRIKKATIPELTDAEAGRFLKKIAGYTENYWSETAKENGWTHKAEMQSEMATLQTIQMVKCCLDTNSVSMTITLEDVNLYEKHIGDWEITVKQVKEPE